MGSALTLKRADGALFAWKATDIPLWAWCLAVVAALAGYDFFSDPGRLARVLGDTDDATRLVQVRQLIAGQGWFDTTIVRLGGPEPLVSHWSRIVDLPIAALIRLFALFVPMAAAETAARFLWPLVLLSLTAFGVARATELRSGRRWPAMIAAVLVAASLAARSFFMPGRIDHHNAMLLSGVIGLLLLAQAHDSKRAGVVAGLMLGIGTSIGYEALFPTGASLVLVAGLAAWAERPRPGFVAAVVAYALTLAAALVLTVAPSQILQVHCDALSINLVVLAGCGAVVLHLMQVIDGRLQRNARLALLAGAGAAGIAAYGALNPVCLAGPFAEVDAVAMRIWLMHVDETRSFLASAAETPIVAVAIVLLLLYGANASLTLARAQPDRAMLRLDAAFLLIAILYAFVMVRVVSYASLLVAVPIAQSLARPSNKPSAERSPRQKLVFAAIAVAIFALAIGAANLMKRLTGEGDSQLTADAFKGCLDRASAAPLAILPPGLAVNDLDLGPLLLAETPNLELLSAPYHRIGKSIVAAHDILLASPGDAARRLAGIGARYLAICDGVGSTMPIAPVPGDALKKLLLDGRPPAFLEPVELPAATPIRVFRFVPDRAAVTG